MTAFDGRGEPDLAVVYRPRPPLAVKPDCQAAGDLRLPAVASRPRGGVSSAPAVCGYAYPAGYC